MLPFPLDCDSVKHKELSLGLRNREGKDALALAVEFNRHNLIPELVQLGCDIDALDGSGNGPLHSAAILGWVESISALLQSGANPLLRNEGGQFAFDVASSSAVRAALSPFMPPGYAATFEIEAPSQTPTPAAAEPDDCDAQCMRDKLYATMDLDAQAEQHQQRYSLAMPVPATLTLPSEHAQEEDIDLGI